MNTKRDEGRRSLETMAAKDNRWTLFLDLDETIISSVEHSQYSKESVKALEKQFMSSPMFKRSERHDMENLFHVWGRPGLQSFLDFAFEHFRVVVWTYGSCDYGWFIISKFILGKKAAKRRKNLVAFLCDVQCEKSQAFTRDTSSPKHLSWLVRHHPDLKVDLNRTIFIDDHPGVLEANRRQVISCPKWEFLKPVCWNDDFLDRVQKEMLRCIQKQAK